MTTARALGTTLEFAWNTFRLNGEPRLTRFLASAFARSHWYDMTPAKQDFGYHIRVPMAQATQRTADWLRENVIGAGPIGASDAQQASYGASRGPMNNNRNAERSTFGIYPSVAPKKWRTA